MDPITIAAIGFGINVVTNIFSNFSTASKQRKEARILDRKINVLKTRKRINSKLIKSRGEESVGSVENSYSLSGIDTGSGSALMSLVNLESVVLDEISRSEDRFDENIFDLTSKGKALRSSADQLTSFTTNAVTSALTGARSYVDFKTNDRFRKGKDKDIINKPTSGEQDGFQKE